MSGNINDYLKYRVSKSEEAFNDAVLLCNNGRWNAAVNRLYYSTFYLVSVLLQSNGIEADSHNGTRSQFNLHYVKIGLVSKENGKLYTNFFEWRQESDYADFIDFEGDFVNELISDVQIFNSQLRQLLNLY